MARHDGRAPGQLRPVTLEPGFIRYPEGSVLINWGNTRVICNATVEESVPPFLKGRGQGWVTAEYNMLPRATQTRSPRDISKLKLNGRAAEIQRLQVEVAGLVVSDSGWSAELIVMEYEELALCSHIESIPHFSRIVNT